MILNSPEEAQVVANLINLAGLHSALVGVDDINREGHFVTVDRIPLEEAGFAGWVKDEPSHGSDRWDEDCGSLQHMGLLNDVSCWSPEAFVCELTSLDDGTCIPIFSDFEHSIHDDHILSLSRANIGDKCHGFIYVSETIFSPLSYACCYQSLKYLNSFSRNIFISLD